MLSVLFIAKLVCCKSAVIGRLLNLEMSSLVFMLSSLFNNPGLYVLPLVKKVLKEIMGFEIDPEVLIIIFTGYLLRGMQMLNGNTPVKKSKRLEAVNYSITGDRLNLAS